MIRVTPRTSNPRPGIASVYGHVVGHDVIVTDTTPESIERLAGRYSSWADLRAAVAAEGATLHDYSPDLRAAGVG